jgi:hypothetical protein
MKFVICGAGTQAIFFQIQDDEGVLKHFAESGS